MKDRFYKQVKKIKGVKILKNISVRDDNNLKIEAKFLYKLEISNFYSIKKVFMYIKKYNIKYYIIGKGSNILFSKDYYNGALIKLMPKKSRYNNIINAGDSLPYLNNNYLKAGISTLNFLTGVPCSIGGAIYMNAGAFNKEMSDIVEFVYAYDIDNDKFVVFTNKECEFSYRDSYFKHNNLLILGAKIKLEYLNKDELLKKHQEYLKLRINKLPLEYPNLGSIFKNPKGLSAGKLIESIGMKGLIVGGGMISKKHANVIINYDNAESKDILHLIKIIQEEVYQKYKILLELEIIIFK